MPHTKSMTIDTVAQIHEFASGAALNLSLVQPHDTPQSCYMALTVHAKDNDGINTHFEGEFTLSPAQLKNRDSIERILESLMDEDHKPAAQEALAKFDQAMPILADQIWERLGDIPTDCEDCLEIEFVGFSQGTNREAVWHWFEAAFDQSVADRMYAPH